MTQSELKPCPFCGGKVVASAQLENALWIEHPAASCLVLRDGIWASEYEWNTRTPPNPSEPLVERVARAIWDTPQDQPDGLRPYTWKMNMSWDEARRCAENALAALPAPADDVVERVNEHLRAARHVMYDEHWLAQAIDKFLSEDAALAKQGG